MKHYSFIAGDDFNLDLFKDYDSFLNNFADVQTVFLNEVEIKLLATLIGIDKLNWIELDGFVFDSYCDISQYTLPEFNETDIEQFMAKWIDLSGREHNMDEWGSLIFLQGLSKKWNQRKYRMIVTEQ